MFNVLAFVHGGDGHANPFAERIQMPFHKLSFDTDLGGSWKLAIEYLNADGTWKDVWAFTRCEPTTGIPFDIVVDEHGVAPDFDITGAFAIPVVSEKVADILRTTCPDDVQLLAFSLPPYGRRFVMNVLPLVDAIDHDSSVIQHWPDNPDECGGSPEKAGQPRGVIRLVIHENPVNQHHVFRLVGWQTVIIASQKIVSEFLHRGVTGVSYTPVSG